MKRSPRTLVADRNPHVRSFVRREMIKSGYQVRLAGDGRALFGWIDHPGTVDLLVLDPELPGADAPRLLERVCRCCPDLPVILHTDNAALYRFLRRGRVVRVGKSGNSIEKLIRVVAAMKPVRQ